MQEALSLPLERQGVRLSEFLAALFQALAGEGVRPCVLRNYEGFPATNIGSDIDFLISPHQLPRAIRALRSIEGIRIVGYAERHYVGNVFLEGISLAPKTRSLEIDFDFGLTFKGLPYLPTDAVLEAAIPRQAENLKFFVPSPVHEAIISLLASLLVGGWLKEKYFPGVQQTFAGERSEAIAALVPQLGFKIATQFVDTVIGGERQKVLDSIRSLRASIKFRSLLYKPCRSASGLVRHYAREFVVRFSPMALETVCILSLDGDARATIIEGLIPILQSTAKVVEKRRLWPRSPFPRGFQEAEAVVDSRAGAPSVSLFSMAKVAQWLVKDWLSLFTEKKSLTLRICESYYHDLLIDLQGQRYGISRWFARLAGKLLPPADLWILLDPGAEAMGTMSLGLPPGEIARRLDAYRSFVKTRKRYVILESNKSVASVTNNAYAAIIDALSQRANRQLDKRSQCPRLFLK
jgi:hypothetical protein